MCTWYNGGVPELNKSTKLRVLFKEVGQQRQWLDHTGLRIAEMAAMCGLSERTIRDWRREKFSMDYDGLQKIARRAGISMPAVKKVPYYSHVKEAGKKGAMAVLKKYGRPPVNEVVRKERWHDWWQKEGKFKSRIIGVSKPVNFSKPSRYLAEFAGIVMGDGGISRYQLTITLHAVDDSEYGLFVSKLITRLFKVPVSIRPRHDCSATDYVVSRKTLTDYCVDQLGLKRGNKIRQAMTIPDWVLLNPEYSKACVRGLFDTDGSVFTHAYQVKGKIYRYKKMAFTSRSLPLLQAVHRILSNLGIKARYAGSDIRIDSIEAVSKYMKIIGSHNPKHLKRYHK